MNISEDSKIWIYQAQRPLNIDEEEAILNKLNNFTSQWQAHGHSLAAYGEIRYHQFIILSVDEGVAGATGCSIDKSVYLMKEIEKEFDLKLFDRFRTAYRSGEDIISCSREEFEDMIKQGSINQETIVFNNLITSRKEMNNLWEIPMKDSWHSKVFTV